MQSSATHESPAPRARPDAIHATDLEHSVLDTTRELAAAFPEDPHLERLVDLTLKWGIRLAPSPVREQWLFHPEFRTLFLWRPDLTEQPLLYLAVILSHELGHALDFDRQPELRELTRALHWSEMPVWVEESAFVQGFLLLHQLGIPIGLQVYTRMIEQPMASRVRRVVESDWACCLLSDRPAAGGQATS